MKQIAVIISGIDEEYQNTILQGIQACASENDTCILHFVSFGGVLCNARHDAGEHNIFELCNYGQLDGVILLTNTICDDTVTSSIVSRLQKYDIPVVSIDHDLDVRFYHIGIDNYKAMYDMVSHIVHDHGCKDVGYVSGPETNPESIQRYRAFEDCMKEHTVPVQSENVYFGSFRAIDGRNAALHFISRPGGPPKAVICANDAMALSVVMTFEEHGYKVPEQIIVTGFDDIHAARNFAPDITSVKRPLYQSGYLAVKRILGLSCDELPESIRDDRSILLDTSCQFRQSCGCTGEENDLESVRDFRRSSLNQLDYFQINIPMVNRMNCELAESNSFQENLEELKNFIVRYGCECFYLCLDENWNEIMEKGMETQYRTHGFPKRMQVHLAYFDGKFTTLPEFRTENMIPDSDWKPETPMMYYFLPLHFRDRAFGYCILGGGKSTKLGTPLLHTFVMNICNSLESIRKMEYMDHAMDELDQLYVRDYLTRINNRNGFNKFTGILFDDCKKKHSQVMLMFIDMDGLKYINDTFSHAEGDNALKQLARCLKLSCRNNEVFARFGGDEFIVFAPDYTEEDAQKIAERMEENMEEYNQTSGKPYKIAASIGWHICEVDEESELYPIITAADKKMYEEKKRKRVSRYLRH